MPWLNNYLYSTAVCRICKTGGPSDAFFQKLGVQLNIHILIFHHFTMSVACISLQQTYKVQQVKSITNTTFATSNAVICFISHHKMITKPMECISLVILAEFIICISFLSCASKQPRFSIQTEFVLSQHKTTLSGYNTSTVSDTLG